MVGGMEVVMNMIFKSALPSPGGLNCSCTCSRPSNRAPFPRGLSELHMNNYF